MIRDRRFAASRHSSLRTHGSKTGETAFTVMDHMIYYALRQGPGGFSL
jgi:hypothetical protein